LDTNSIISTKTGLGSDTDIIFQKQDRIGYKNSTIRSFLICILWSWQSASYC